jgi:uncharacterized protein YkwD
MSQNADWRGRAASLALVAVTVVALFAPAWPAAAQVPETPAESAAQAKTEELALLLNRARIAAGVRPLLRNAPLDTAARLHSRDMAEQGYLDHTAMDGSEPMDRAIRHGYNALPGTGWIVVEVISAISAEPVGPLNWWLQVSPAVHGRVLKNPRWREMGLGYAAGGPYGNYWTVLVGCQPDILPAVLVDGQLFQHSEDCVPA